MQSQVSKLLLGMFLIATFTLVGPSCYEETTPPPPPPAPVINSFTANPATITKGDSCTLSWDVTGAESVVIDSGIGDVPSSGDIETKPSSTTTYTLEATNPARVTKSVTVIVTAPPPGATEPVPSPEVTEPVPPAPVTEPASSTPKREYDSSLPTQMGAFRGKVLWGDKPVVKAKAVAGIQNPDDGPVDVDDLITETTDDEGNYEVWVHPFMYYVGCIMPGSDRISYWDEYGQLAEARQAIIMNLQAMDWSIRSLSPGVIKRDFSLVTEENPPTLLWEEYNWAKYGEKGYYQVEVITDDSDYYHNLVIDVSTESTSYTAPNPLKKGKYRWKVMAYTKTGKPIACNINERYFQIE
jgi:hypothetical protein